MSQKFPSSLGFILEAIVVVLFNVERAVAWFEYCDHTVNLGVNASVFINSPYYPDRYPPGSSCRYTIVAPLDYEINIECNVNLDQSGGRCTTEFFYISVDGDQNMRNSEYLCGVGYAQRRSIFNRLAIAYTSSSTSAAGTFSCYVTTRPQPCDCGWSVTSKITSGQETRINEFPFMVALFYRQTNAVFCGGTIISHRHILSAAHCFAGNFNDVNSIIAVVGEHDLKTEAETPYTRRHTITSLKIHEGYDALNSFNDIAILFASTDIEWSRGVGPICLPFLYSFAPFDGRKGDIVGWGATSFAASGSTVLMKATVDIITNNECRNTYSNLMNSQICNYSPPKDACQYDSGGPLVVRLQRLFAAGIISFGKACGTNSPSVNTRVTSYLNWIQTNTGANFCRRS